MYTYDPKNVNTSFNNVNIDGYGPDTFIKVARDEDGWSYQPSNSGRGARSRNPNKAGTIEITLSATSPANGLLTAISVQDDSLGTGVGAFLVKDRSTAAALCSARNAWIQKRPDWERAKESGVVTWLLRSDDIHIAHDGIVDIPT